MIRLISYTGNLIKEGVQDSKPLINGILWEDDLVMLLGSEKAGKSILALQMSFALTTASTFLDKYEVPTAVSVLYIQTEGKRSQVIDRLERMQESLSIDLLKFYHLPKKFLPIDIQEYFEAIITEIDSYMTKPKVIIIDALYMAMAGDLIDNKDARLFLSRVAFLMDRYQCSVIVVHHETKPSLDENYNEVDRGDKSSYGSVFFRAIVDHILYLKMNRDKSRTFSCNTQRSGKVMEKEDLILIEPNPLCFEIKGDYKAYEEVVKHHIFNSNGVPLGKEDLIRLTGLSQPSIEKATRHLLQDNLIKKTSVYPVKYCKK